MASLSGFLRLRARAHPSGRTLLGEQAFRAPFHLSKPYWDEDARTLLVNVVNPTAGILAGDTLESDIHSGRGSSLLVTTPSASRVFTMRTGAAECRQSFGVAAGGWLEVSPEPLVPHRGSRYRQITTIDVEPGGELFFVDSLLPGRLGHGEAWQWEQLTLDLQVRVGGELILRERFCHAGDELRRLSEQFGSGPTACFANAILITDRCTPSAPEWRRALECLNESGVRLGVSALPKTGWAMRIVTSDPLRLHAALADVRRTLAHWVPGLRCDPRKL